MQDLFAPAVSFVLGDGQAVTGKSQARADRLAVDIGGTFTDVVLETGSERFSTKVLTTHQAPEKGALEGIDRLLQEAGRNAADIGLLIHGTTLATNALIERKGARTALITSEGFRDILEMGFEKRFAQYHLNARPPAPLVPRQLRLEVAERISAEGHIVTALDEAQLVRLAGELKAAGVEAVAVGFLHAYAHAQHEKRAAEILAAELPEATICLSSEICPEIREYERFSTTVANAYIRPLMSGYLGRLKEQLASGGFTCPTYLMMSGGGLTTLEQAARIPIRLVESGPAGGAILAADIARARGIDRALAFDMGGTTAKICLIDDGEPDRSRQFEVARSFRDMKGSGLPVRIPVIEMVEIGAGGGSIARIDAMGQIRVGPDSAGSDPGPVAYQRGGTAAAVTDANLVLGKIDPQDFAGGRIQLDATAAARTIAETIGQPLGLEGVWPAVGIAEIVEENMANAARVHAIERGKQSSEYVMIAFGGGAPLHAARLAEKLGIDQVIVPVGAGVGSAIGFLRAPVSFQLVRSWRVFLDSNRLAEMNSLLEEMTGEATRTVRQGAGEEALHISRQLELRYSGQGHELPVSLPDRPLKADDLAAIRTAFESLYEKVYGLTMPELEIECISWSVTASNQPEQPVSIDRAHRHNRPDPQGTRAAYDAATGGLCEHDLYQRSQLAVGDHLSGPAIIAEAETSTLIPSGFTMQIDQGGALVLTRNPREAS